MPVLLAAQSDRFVRYVLLVVLVMGLFVMLLLCEWVTMVMMVRVTFFSERGCLPG